MMNKGVSTKSVNFHTSRAVFVLGCIHIGYTVKMHYFLNVFFSTSRHRSDKPILYMISNEGSAQIVNLMNICGRSF